METAEERIDRILKTLKLELEAVYLQGKLDAIQELREGGESES